MERSDAQERARRRVLRVEARRVHEEANHVQNSEK